MMVDVASWYLIKVFHPFVFVEIAAGALLAACVAFMWLAALYQVWIMQPPDAVVLRERGGL